MDATEQAAEQIVRMTLYGSEVVLRLSGAGAKNIAAALVAAASSTEQTKGKTRLSNMLKSNKELKVFQINAHDLKDFAKEAKQYGVLYVVISKAKGIKGETLDLMVKAEDASKLNRIIDKLELASIDAGRIEEVARDIEESRKVSAPAAADRGIKGRDTSERLLEELMEKPRRRKPDTSYDPLAKDRKERSPSEPISKRRPRSGRDLPERAVNNTRPGRQADTGQAKESVRERIEDIRRERAGAPDADKPKTPTRQTDHIQPVRKAGRTNNTKGR